MKELQWLAEARKHIGLKEIPGLDEKVGVQYIRSKKRLTKPGNFFQADLSIKKSNDRSYEISRPF